TARAGLPLHSGRCDNFGMGQLGFFTRVQLAEMRDRTKSRRYSPEAEAFRRDHARHRAWGLTQRHAQKLRRAREVAAREVAAPVPAAPLPSGRSRAVARAHVPSKPVPPSP